MNPTVTFVVPCYKLAHLLPECIKSILSQTYDDFEVLIMDDQSPDNTPEVATSFGDPRVKHIRNETNLGHLRNYNRGIELARGKYIWLISADDRLRTPRALAHYVQTMQRYPNVGYVFCPGVGLVDGEETGVLEWTKSGDMDLVWDGRKFLEELAVSNRVLAPSGMVHRRCYEKLGAFPVDLPYAGDWYLWCLFALYYDAAYVAEPMVNYRLHSVSMTHILGNQGRITDNTAVRWRMRRQAQKLGYKEIAEHWLRSLSDHYAYCVCNATFGTSHYAMNLGEFECSVTSNAADHYENCRIRGRVYEALGDGWYRAGDRCRALEYYQNSIQQDRWMLKVWVKKMLLHMGWAGDWIRQTFWPGSHGKVESPRAQSC